jgi:hypothetical protein
MLTKNYFVHILSTQSEPTLIGFRNTEPSYPKPMTGGYAVPRTVPENSHKMYGKKQADWFPALMMPESTNELKNTFTARENRARPIR